MRNLSPIWLDFMAYLVPIIFCNSDMGDTYVWLLMCVYSCWYMCICMFVCVYAPWSSFYTVSQFLLVSTRWNLFCKIVVFFSVVFLMHFNQNYKHWNMVLVFPWNNVGFFCFILCFHLHPLCRITFCSLCICRLSFL